VATVTAFRGRGYCERMDVVPAVFGAAAGLAGLLLVFLGVSISAFQSFAGDVPAAATARFRVVTALWWAAAMTWWELSTRIGGVLWLVFLDLADHAVQVAQDLLVHLDYAGVPIAGGDVDEGERAVPLLA